MPMILAETHLVKRARMGDVQAFEALMVHHTGRVRSRAHSITRNAADTEEVVQDVFVTLFRKLETFTGRAKLATWLYRVATNAALDQRRKRRPGREVLFADFPIPSAPHRSPDSDPRCVGSPPTPDSELLSGETRRLLRVAIDQLSPPARVVLRLMTFEGLSSEATAHVVGESLAAVKSRLHRARKTLRAQFPESRPPRLARRRRVTPPHVGPQ